MTRTYNLSSFDSQSNTDESSSCSPDEFFFVKDESGLPIRMNPLQNHELTLELHPIKTEDALLVSVQPPLQPKLDIKHVPCDIVLVIDVSGSMADPAPLPDVQNDDDKPEVSGLSILDLTKHAARTILQTLNKDDRLAIVTFSQDAKLVQPLVKMTEHAKKKTNEKIEKLEDEGATNLWAGIKKGLQVIEESETIGNVQGIYVLTDGMPNHMCPRQGYVAKLKPMMEEMARTRSSIPTIHTFGFGYSIVSNLLQSIAEAGSGNYAFIPEAGMIGTVFVHAVANLYSTYATSAKLKLVGSKNTTLCCTSGLAIESPDPSELHITLGNIQYGQSRDTIVFATGSKMSPIYTTLTYKLPSGEEETITSTINLSSDTSLPQPLKDYHMHRNSLCSYLTNLFPLAPNGEHVRYVAHPETAIQDITDMANGFKSRSQTPSDPNITSLLNDLFPSAKESQDGQISHALNGEEGKNYWRKWGRHYLPSLLHAHLRQQCNSFKDPGPLRYGMNSPLFLKCRDELDEAFDNLPAPKPSITGEHLRRLVNSVGSGGGRIATNVNMSRYNYVGNPCFLGSCIVKMADGRSNYELQVQDLRTGMEVLNPFTRQPREVAAVIKTAARQGPNQKICRIGASCWITPYHPIFHHPTRKWVFPVDVAEETRELEESEAVYSVLLSPSKGASSHAIAIEGVSCVTLGHGLVSKPRITAAGIGDDNAGDADVRIHPFFGNYPAVLANLSQLPQNTAGVYLCAGVERQSANETFSTGLVSGFIPAKENTMLASKQVERNSFISEIAEETVDAVRKGTGKSTGTATKSSQQPLPSIRVSCGLEDGAVVWWESESQRHSHSQKLC